MCDELYELPLGEVLHEAITWWQMLYRGEIEGYTPDAVTAQGQQIKDLKETYAAVERGQISYEESEYADCDQRLRDYCIKMRRRHGSDGPW